jgi:hypothetical protein
MDRAIASAGKIRKIEEAAQQAVIVLYGSGFNVQG